MKLFDRFKKENRAKPVEEATEDDSIYKDDSKTSGLTSFAFGFFALVLTLLIVGGIFFGARAIYRAVHNDKSSSNTANNSSNQQPVNNNSKSSGQEKGTGSTDNSGSGSPSSTPSTGDNLPNTGDNLTLPKTGDPGM